MLVNSDTKGRRERERERCIEWELGLGIYGLGVYLGWGFLLLLFRVRCKQTQGVYSTLGRLAGDD